MSSKLLKISNQLLVIANTVVLSSKYGIGVSDTMSGPDIKVIVNSLKDLPPELVRDCKIGRLGFEDLGKSKDFYPNHGKYIDGGTLIMNSRVLEDTKLDTCIISGKSINKFDQTLFHELGHGWDHEMGISRGLGSDLSLLPEWLSLSDWSEVPVPGHKRMIIRDKGLPDVKDEWYYNPEAGFTRFYAKRNPWDDWADSFSYYVAGLKSFLPQNKIQYFDRELSPYYKEY